MFPKLRRRLDGGKGLKESTLLGKIRREYDRNRDVGNQTVRHYLIETTDKSIELVEFLDKAREAVVGLLGDNPGQKAAVVVNAKLVNPTNR